MLTPGKLYKVTTKHLWCRKNLRMNKDDIFMFLNYDKTTITSTFLYKGNIVFSDSFPADLINWTKELD